MKNEVTPRKNEVTNAKNEVTDVKNEVTAAEAEIGTDGKQVVVVFDVTAIFVADCGASVYRHYRVRTSADGRCAP